MSSVYRSGNAFITAALGAGVPVRDEQEADSPPIHAPRCATTEAANRSTATPPTSWPPSSPAPHADKSPKRGGAIDWTPNGHPCSRSRRRTCGRPRALAHASGDTGASRMPWPPGHGAFADACYRTPPACGCRRHRAPGTRSRNTPHQRRPRSVGRRGCRLWPLVFAGCGSMPCEPCPPDSLRPQRRSVVGVSGRGRWAGVDRGDPAAGPEHRDGLGGPGVPAGVRAVRRFQHVRVVRQARDRCV